MRRGAICLLMLGLGATTFAQELMTPELLWKLGRIGETAVSPDGKEVVYGVTRYDLAENKGETDLWIVPMGGGSARRLTNEPGGESDIQWVKTATGQRLWFTAKRGDDKARQAYSMNTADGSVMRHSDVAAGVSNLKMSPDGKNAAFTIDVKLDKTVQDLYPDLPKADARIIDGLLYRHWNEWHDFAYSHVHVAPVGDDGKLGAPVDLMPELRADCPMPPFGGSEQFAWSPDGKQIALTIKITNSPATSTDSDIYLVDVAGERKLRCITTGMDGYDIDPSYSPDGKWIAFHSMARAGFEADKNRLFVHERETGALFDLTADHDLTTHGARWTPDSKGLWFYSEQLGTEQIFHVALDNAALTQVTKGDFDFDLRGMNADGSRLVLGRQNHQRPTELVTIAAAGGEVSAITDVNGDVYSKLALPTSKAQWTRATDGQMIHSWVIYPPNFDPKKKYPTLLYCQGGPQGQVGQWFSYRWNFHLMAAKGYIVLAPNRRGLPGFGQAWNDEISGDWGGQAMQDLLACTDAILTEPYVDHERVSAVGASFGGYSVFWLMGNHDGRFRSMIAHCGCFNLESMFGSTEELWFADWDLGGPYWVSEDARARYDAFSPHRFVRNWKTPLLVIHNEKDFRVPLNQGMEAFTAAQLEGVPSRFLYFPEEGHWVTKPQNSVLWQRVFFDWLGR